MLTIDLTIVLADICVFLV